MRVDNLKPDKVLRGPIFPEPVQVIVIIPMGSTVKRMLNILRDPGTRDWQPVIKIEQYRLRQNSVKHPVELREEPPEYRTS